MHTHLNTKEEPSFPEMFLDRPPVNFGRFFFFFQRFINFLENI